LEALGCDAIQGYYINRPVPADDLIHWLEQYQSGDHSDDLLYPSGPPGYST